MKFTNLFTKTLREAPADEIAVNAKLLIRAGFIQKIMAGVYVFLPLGLRVLDKINAIIRQEINATGAEELFLSVFQSKETWMTTNRWETGKEVMYQFKDSSDKDIGLGWTHEEPITLAAKHCITSYKDLPRAVYQIQTKFRNEARAKSGILRGREFLMKDLYSFHTDEQDLNTYYERVADAYANIFSRVGVIARRTLASGGLFSKFSDEYQVVCPIGEDSIFTCDACSYAANAEIAHELKLKDVCPQCKGSLRQVQSIEVGNIFKLGTKFSEPMGLLFSDESGERKPVVMASYGIGPGRLMGTVVETSHDDRGILWPENIAPYRVHLIALDGGEQKADALYDELNEKEIEVLYDNRTDKTAGEKFADADLIGCPIRLVVSEKSIQKGGIELKRRCESSSRVLSEEEILNSVA